MAENTTYDYDLAVIGAGSAGTRAARRAAELGKRVAVIEEDRVGGTCVLRGCVPKKLFVHGSHYAEAFEDAVGFGWRVDGLHFDWATLATNVQGDVAWLSGIYIRNLEKAGAEIVRSRGVLKDAHTVALVGQNRDITAGHILIATGGKPRRDLPIPGIELAITSNEFFHLPRLPKRALVVGGGYVAIEIASVFAALGCDTTIIHRGSEILRGFDREARQALHAGMERRGVTINLGEELAEIRRQSDGLLAVTRSGAEIAVDEVLLAVGRTPNTSGLGLEAAGVKADRWGAVTVDRYSQTNVPNIYAVGDVTNRLQFTPIAIREGSAFVETVFGGNPTAVDYDTVPVAVFGTPEVGSVGMTEEAARKEFPSLDIYRANFKPLPNRVAGRDERMLIKLIVDADTDRVLGCHLVGPSASELIQLMAVAIRMGATKADLDATTALHPTLAEEIVTLGRPAERIRREAAE
ncbi:MAG TPA: glutathione-disulfide reductase [Bauldia sp.]|nr:glutathione-disulfide reductase [Bauldia sp.]